MVAWVVLMALLGVGIGLVVFRPWDHHVPISLSGAQTLSPVGQVSGSASPGATKSVTPSAGGTCPDIVVHKTEEPNLIPGKNAWVHASDGVNVRADPSSSAPRLTTLATGTRFAVNGQRPDPDGSTWYFMRLSDGRDGWLASRFTTNYPIAPAATDSLKIWLPVGYQFHTVAVGKAEARYLGAPLALLYLESGARDQAPAEAAVPGVLPDRSTWAALTPEVVVVGDFPAIDQAFAIALAGGGCQALVHQIRLVTTTRYYDFIFLVDKASSPVVAQLLDSATAQQ
jgi:Bacterial SH3 domain